MILVKLLVNLLVKLTKLGIGGAIGAWGLGCTPVPGTGPHGAGLRVLAGASLTLGYLSDGRAYGTSLTTEPTPP